MKITVCGKGGCGKSTVSALLAKEFERMGKTVLVADSDESNYGLHRQLGVKLPRDFTEYFGGKEKAFKTMMVGEILDTVKLSAFAKKFYSEPFTLNEIPEEYIARNNGVMLISSGKIHQANEGCACTMNSILKQFIKHLTVGENEVVLLDMEAGVEHFGRGVDNSVDWELSRKVDAGSTNTLIDQIFLSIEDLIDAKMVCGAGGGGFLQVILKKGVQKTDVHKRLKDVFQDNPVDVWNCEIM